MAGAYSPFEPAARPGTSPTEKPRYRVLVHRRFSELWNELANRVGLAGAQQFYDHVSTNPGQPPPVNSATILRGKAGAPKFEGSSRTIHYEISGAGRINYQFANEFTGGLHGDPHRVVFILAIDFDSH